MPPQLTDIAVSSCHFLELIPDWLAWLVWIMPLTYGVRILLIGEFGGDRCDNVVTIGDTNSCTRIIDNSGANADDVWWYYLVLLLLFVIFRLGALVILRKKANKFY